MRYSAKLVGTGALLLMVTACAGPDMSTAHPAAGGDSAAPTGSVSTSPLPSESVPPPKVNSPGKPRLTVPQGSLPVPAAQIDASALPAGYPHEVWTPRTGDIHAQISQM